MGITLVKLRKWIAISAVAGFAVACAPIDRFHGFVPTQAELDTIEVGVTTKEQIVTTLGTPIADRALLNNTIYYASSQFRYFGPFAPEVVDRQVLAIDFDANDRVRNISRYTLDDGQVIVLNRRVTEDGIRDVTFLSQLLGSFGNFDAGTFLGDN